MEGYVYTIYILKEEAPSGCTYVSETGQKKEENSSNERTGREFGEKHDKADRRGSGGRAGEGDSGGISEAEEPDQSAGIP